MISMLEICTYVYDLLVRYVKDVQILQVLD